MNDIPVEKKTVPLGDKGNKQGFKILAYIEPYEHGDKHKYYTCCHACPMSYNGGQCRVWIDPATKDMKVTVDGLTICEPAHGYLEGLEEETQKKGFFGRLSDNMPRLR